ncbi:hypothetical protein EZV62_003310 [Acer yangbiense]|uniref:Growth-regulating factor n=1 Tax=Acer yangbiense TaxID=1000413 RepID=A0A5C7IH54_9ROSI|nr:hypothetical protein EZV62_003310 [Acer yangbiense]
MMTTSATSSGRDITMRSPFTPSQWQELEHQALIFKYMVSGVAIPPELIYSVKRSLDSSMNTRLFPHQPKKQIQSLEGAEEQMAKNGGVQKKHIQTPSTVRGTCTEAEIQNKSTYNMISSSGFSSPHDHINNTTNTPHHMFLDSGSCSDKDYRYFHGIKDHQGVVDERDFFPEASGSIQDDLSGTTTLQSWKPPPSTVMSKRVLVWWVISDLFLVENFVAGRDFVSAF